MKKALCIITALLFISLCACAPLPAREVIVIDTPAPQATAHPAGSVPTEPPASTDEATQTPTEAPSPAPAAVPTEEPTPVPTEAPRTPVDAADAAALYSYRAVDIPYVDRPTLVSQNETTPSRYHPDPDGIYRMNEPRGQGEAVLYFTGDLMCQTRQQLAGESFKGGYDFEESFDYVRELFGKADLVIGNLEGSFSDQSPYMCEQNRVEDSYNLNAPSTFVQAVRNAGFDMVIMSNNHVLDSDVRGIYDTLDCVDRYELMHTGLYRNGEEERTFIAEVNGIRIGILNYSTFFNRKEWHLNDLGKDTLLNIYTKERLERDMARVRERGAEYVIVCMHWGIEYADSPSVTRYLPASIRGAEDRGIELPIALDFQLKWAQEIADAGADYIVGSHTHSIQPYDVIKSADGRNVPVIYSMGNFVSHQKKAGTNDTLILRVTLTKEGGKVVLKNDGYIPTKIFEVFMGKDYVVIPVVKPYCGDLESKSFSEAYYRIVKAVGWKISVLGWL